ncbi:MAG: ABC transporter ATP-binding protein [Lachnospiraceae bacterium]|nr:ABC transporter ATP-binding protein [Lachnospiraceae bacterium]
MIIFENVFKSFGQKEVLENVNVHLQKGKIYGICGRNGSGKSVFMKLAAGMLYPTAGEITVNGKRLKKGEFPADTGILMDSVGFLRDQTGYRNLKILAAILNKVDDSRIREVMEMTGLRADDRTVYGRYSSGMKQKLLLAQAIMEYPSLLLLDEPFNALDEESERRFLSLLCQMNQEYKTTMVIISHDREGLHQICHHLYQVKDRTLISDETGKIV